jgi:hypothetical protein
MTGNQKQEMVFKREYNNSAGSSQEHAMLSLNRKLGRTAASMLPFLAV